MFEKFLQNFFNPYYLICKINSDDTAEEISKISYKFEIRENLSKKHFIENFEIFLEISSNILKFFSFLKNFLPCIFQKQNLIEYEVTLGGARNKTKASIILAFSQNVLEYFKNVKNNFTDNPEMMDKTNREKLEKIFSHYKSLCEEISKNFQDAANFKFFESNENFSFNQRNSEQSKFSQFFFRIRGLLLLSVNDANNKKIDKLYLFDFLERIINLIFEESSREEI